MAIAGDYPQGAQPGNLREPVGASGGEFAAPGSPMQRLLAGARSGCQPASFRWRLAGTYRKVSRVIGAAERSLGECEQAEG